MLCWAGDHRGHKKVYLSRQSFAKMLECMCSSSYLYIHHPFKEQESTLIIVTMATSKVVILVTGKSCASQHIISIRHHKLTI